MRTSTAIPPTPFRVPRHTASEINARIRRETERRIAYYLGLGRDDTDRRLAELDREWDIERTLEANAAGIALTGLMLGAFADRRWFLLPAVVATFLLQHAIQGWCPPVPLFRRLGIRTAREIDHERCALKAARGDFNIDKADAGRLLHAAMR
jgi:hypothetical protein